MTAPTIPPARQNPASPEQRQAARDHVTQLRQHGWTYRSIAAATALSPNTVYDLVTGRRTAQPGTATAVLKLTRRILSGSRLDATGTRLRLRALHVMGHGSARIARAAGAHPQTIRKLVRGDARTVSPRLRTAIIVVYDAWWDKRAPARTRSERAAATIARKRAIAGNWCAGRRPGRRPARPTRLPAPGRLDARHRHRHRPRHSPARTPAEKDARMPDDDRLTWEFITDVLDVMERHGYHRGDNEHTGQAIGLIRDVARIYEGTLDPPRGGYVVVPSSQPTAPQPPGQPAVIVPANQVKTLLAALDDAAEYKRDRAETCADCADQSCTTCQWRLQTADTYDQLAEQTVRAAEASATRPRAPGRGAPDTDGPHAAADREAGQ